jgi:hypothetical protein
VPEELMDGSKKQPGGVSVSPVVQALKNAALILGVMAAIAYGVLRIAYVQYYQEFRVLPEQAGLGKTELLTQALVGPVILLALMSLVVLLVAVPSAAIRVSREHRKNEHAPRLNSREGRLSAQRKIRRLFWPVLLGGILFAFLVLVAALLYFANGSADRAIHKPHEALLGRYVGLGPYSIPLLDVRALPTDVEWVGSGTAPTIITRAGACMMYLGGTTDTVLLWDAMDDPTITVPKEDVIVELRTPSSGLPLTCPEPPPSAPG